MNPDSSQRPIPPRRLWWLAAGFGAWCVALAVLYALHAIGCAFAWPTGTLRMTLVLVLLASLLGMAWMWRLTRPAADPAYGPPGTFLQQIILWTVITAFVATLLTLAPPLLLSACV